VSARIEHLRRAVEKTCLCKAIHKASEPVVERVEAKTVWEGMVEMLDLEGHDNAKIGYAFTLADTDGMPVVKTVLGVSPIDSVVLAVRAAIASQRRNERANNVAGYRGGGCIHSESRRNQ
jgi:hypothetical protein